MKKLIVILFFGSSATLCAQTPVIDKANYGQAKRMVFQQWNDWEPTPETNWLGLPKNMKGWLYWRVLHSNYYKGEDKRPYRPSGPFMQNHASLTLQQKDDAHIQDSMQKVMQTNAATYVSMSGGAGDLAWSLYFNKQFERLINQVPSRIVSISAKHPVAASKILQNKYYNEFVDYLSIVQDKLEAIHNSYVDRGERIVAYLEVYKELEKRNSVMNEMINTCIQLTRLPTVQEVEEAKKKKMIYTNDAEIVRSILVNFNF